MRSPGWAGLAVRAIGRRRWRCRAPRDWPRGPHAAAALRSTASVSASTRSGHRRVAQGRIAGQAALEDRRDAGGQARAIDPQGRDGEVERLQPPAGKAAGQKAGQAIIQIQTGVKNVGGRPDAVAAEAAHFGRRICGRQAQELSGQAPAGNRCRSRLVSRNPSRRLRGRPGSKLNHTSPAWCKGVDAPASVRQAVSTSARAGQFVAVGEGRQGPVAPGRPSATTTAPSATGIISMPASTSSVKAALAERFRPARATSRGRGRTAGRSARRRRRGVESSSPRARRHATRSNRSGGRRASRIEAGGPELAADGSRAIATIAEQRIGGVVLAMRADDHPASRVMRGMGMSSLQRMEGGGGNGKRQEEAARRRCGRANGSLPNCLARDAESSERSAARPRAPLRGLRVAASRWENTTMATGEPLLRPEHLRSFTIHLIPAPLSLKRSSFR